MYWNASTGIEYAVAFSASSDERLKKDIKPLDNALEKLKQINGVEFVWKNNDKHSIGVIAQNLENIYPSLVETNPDNDSKSVIYNGLIGVLIEAVKELSGEVERLKGK